MNSGIELSVVILGYKAENYLVEFVNQIESEILPLNIPYELVVVANYDLFISDSTPQIAHNLAKDNPNIKVVSLEKKGRMGWDMRSGFEATTGQYIAVIDGDGQMPASDIPAVYTIIKNGSFDLVKTVRRVRYDGLIRSLLSKIYNIAFKLLYLPSIPVNDINAKPKIFRRSAYEKMNLISSDWFTDAEIMIEAINKKMEICEIATVFHKNRRRKSFIGLSTIIEFCFNLVKYKFIRK